MGRDWSVKQGRRSGLPPPWVSVTLVSLWTLGSKVGEEGRERSVHTEPTR